jgi:hypothetical protein
MSFHYPETIADGVIRNDVRPAREHVDGETRRRSHSVCKHLLPAESPGALPEHCKGTPNDFGWCPEHFPK